MEPIVKCENVSIRYITGDFKDIGLKEYMMRRIKGDYHVTEFWADRHVSFELMPGDMLGIIGSNGAGKSTILKAISGIMVPTEGWVRCDAKISALLELGSGFDGDLTVRENAYLRAAMLGYSREFVDSRYQEIIEFAELVDFQDRPFKQLSSGMKSRLAFAIASLVDPEILILDEVLSVGDGAFRKKSEAKMRQIIGGGATTILVSHSLGQVRSMCNKILWLHKGEQIAFGDNVQGLCDAYQKFLDTKVLPTPSELPELWLPRSEKPSVIVADAPKTEPTEVAPEATSQAEAPAEPEATKPSLLARFKALPKAVHITLIAFAILTGVIAVDESLLPGRVAALPNDPSNVLVQDAGRGATICVWDEKLYAFVPADQASGAVLHVHTVDNHGYEKSGDYPMVTCTSSRYSTDDTRVVVVNLGEYPGYVTLDCELD